MALPPRQVNYDPPRQTGLFIVMVMCNKDDGLLARVHGVVKKIAYLCKRDRSKTWGKHGWKKVVVCIVARRSTHRPLASSQPQARIRKALRLHRQR